MDYGKALFLFMRVRWFSLGMPWIGYFGLSSTFMLGIWHEGDWLERDLAHPIYGRLERGSPIPGWILHSLKRGYLLDIL